MIITLYNNSAKKTQLNKSNYLAPIGSATFHFKDDTSVQHPSILLEKNSELLNANYVYIDILDRYYFIDNITLLKGGIMQFDLSVDVLHTYREDIKKATAYIERSETLGNRYLNDTYFPINTNRSVHRSPIIGSFGSTLYNYLVVTGGVQ